MTRLTLHQQPNYPVLSDPKTLEQYDGFLFGIPTRYGNYPAQFKAFWDKTVRRVEPISVEA